MACPMGMHRQAPLEAPPVFEHTSIFALVTVAALVSTAYTSSIIFLGQAIRPKYRTLFVWHAFNFIVHLTLQVAFLYNVFYTSMSANDIAYTRGIHSVKMTSPGVSFLGDPNRLHGAFYGTSTTSSLWQEYAKADKRWGGADTTITSLVLLTVVIMGPLSLYVCQLLRNQQNHKASFWMVVVATGELYGLFMTFSPEWLTGSPNLDTSNRLTLWIYLGLFNVPWVVFPIWILWSAYHSLMAPVQESAPTNTHTHVKEAIKF